MDVSLSVPHSSVRWDSTAASLQPQFEPEPKAVEFERPLDPSKQPKSSAGHAAIESDQPEFSTLKDSISYSTLKAITVNQ